MEIADPIVMQNWIFVTKMLAENNDKHLTNEQKVLKFLANFASETYTCNRPPGAAGAILLAGDKAVMAGVKPPHGSPTCLEAGCEMVDGHCVRAVHAERRAILTAAKFGYSTLDATIYSVLKPCYECTKEIIAAGITRIYYAAAAYDEERTRKILSNAEVICEKLDIELEYGK